MIKITAKRLETKFRKLRGKNNDVKLWGEIAPEQQDLLTQGITLDSEEVPVIATMDGPMPIIITTARIAWRSHGRSHSLPFDQLARVKAPKFLHASKLDMNELVITDLLGNEHLLKTRPGTSLLIVWNLVLLLVRNRKL